MGISVFKPFINRKDMDSVLSCLVSEKLENGPVARELSSEIGRYLGVEEGWLLKEYRRAIEIVFRSIDAQEKKLVLISPLAPVYYKSAAEDAGLEIVPVDVDPETACISTDILLQIIEERGESIHSVVVDSPFGFVPDLEKIEETGVKIIEDISNSIGSGNGERKSGSFGDFVIVNMDPEKIITSGTGTFVSSKSRKEKELLKNTITMYGADILLPDMNAAAALNQIANIEKVLQARREIAEIYSQAVMKTRNRTLSQKNDFINVYPSFPVMAETGTKEIKKYASKKGVEVIEAFENSIISKLNISDCPEAKNLNLRCLLFPLYPNMGKSNAEKVVKILSTLP